jgi:hypothetical protein
MDWLKVRRFHDATHPSNPNDFISHYLTKNNTYVYINAYIDAYIEGKKARSTYVPATACFIGQFYEAFRYLGPSLKINTPNQISAGTLLAAELP